MYEALTRTMMTARRDEVLTSKGVENAKIGTSAPTSAKKPRNIQEAAMQRLQRKGKK